MFPLRKHLDSRENKTNCLPGNHTSSVYYLTFFHWFFCQVYYVRFVANLEQDEDERYQSLPMSSGSEQHQKPVKRAKFASEPVSPTKAAEVPPSYPASVSIEQLLNAGKFVKPVSRTKAVLNLESFDLLNKEWKTEKCLTLYVDDDKFASGAFRDAFKATAESGSQCKEKWVVKEYNVKSKNTIEDTLQTTIEIHTRKQVQMHTVARQLTKQFSTIVPEEFGQSFAYNKVFYSRFNGKAVTVEEFVSGQFTKYVNNDGKCIIPKADAHREFKEIFDKAQCLVHYTSLITEEKLMLLDIQGSGYSLYDPEIATADLIDAGEVFFCCGNLSSTSIDTFKKDHLCNKYCDMVGKVLA